jgi:phage baseplate assembly protein W
MGKSIRTPFSLSGGRVVTTDDSQTQTKQKIVDVVVTNRYERPVLPEYGGNLTSLIFEGVDELVELDFKTDVADEIVRRVTGASLIDIVSKQLDDSTVELTVYYRTPLSTVQSATIQVVVPGTLDEESLLQ